ncbi:hypothetical protein PENTCL1PPCAC_23022, partial [Pristionchus entomophagus]
IFITSVRVRDSLDFSGHFAIRLFLVVSRGRGRGFRRWRSLDLLCCLHVLVLCRFSRSPVTAHIIAILVEILLGARISLRHSRQPPISD